MDSVHHIWCPLFSQEFQDLPDGAETTLTTITLQLKDKYGQTLVTRKMETEAFGDSNATRTTDAFLETECVENVATTEIIKATEESNGHRVSLPLSVFNPQDYHPLLITVSGKNVN
ncbi:hypothetical protein AWP77_20900 [Escherichia coli]|nr:hypothetical protein AWP77_20900 [Escherichia coli]OKW55050.1 hypothetical protein AWP76_10645 [Escherichia coli]